MMGEAVHGLDFHHSKPEVVPGPGVLRPDREKSERGMSRRRIFAQSGWLVHWGVGGFRGRRGGRHGSWDNWCEGRYYRFTFSVSHV